MLQCTLSLYYSSSILKTITLYTLWPIEGWDVVTAVDLDCADRHLQHCGTSTPCCHVLLVPR